MSMRALFLLIGLTLIGNAEALAVNAPLTADSRTADPREDLFASKPRNGTPAAAVAPPAAAAVERPLTGNPLWGIPLGRLTATREKPLFAPSRHPPPVAVVAAPAAVPAALPPKPFEPEKPQLSLLGTVAGGRVAAGVGLFMDSATKAVLRLRAGENHKGWTLRAVRPHQVELARGLDSVVLDLPSPDMKAGGPAPMLAAPSAMPAPPSPASSALPVNAAKATGAIPPAGAPGMQPATFNPPPAQVSPFQNKWLR